MITDADREGLARREAIRAEGDLPRLDWDRELAKLEAAKRARVFEAVFQLERSRFDQWISEGQGFFAKMGRWSAARQLVKSELQAGVLKSE
jgi:hypothetical protein